MGFEEGCWLKPVTIKILWSFKERYFSRISSYTSKTSFIGSNFLFKYQSGFFILLSETNSEFNTIKLENSYTTIDQKGILTNISAGHAIITNNYENFDFSDNVVIVKKSRDFNLKSKTLSGNFDKGNYNTNDQVDIVSKNISIKGNGLIVRNNGDYMKVKGKAFLEMLY